MNDDWRLQVSLRESGRAAALRERLDAHTLERELEGSFEDRVIVSVDGAEVFCYAGSREQAGAAEELIRGVAAEHGWEIDTELTRWHPDAEAWESPDAPLPETADQAVAEHAQRIERERAEAGRQGFPTFEVRVQLRSERESQQFAERLREEGLPVLRRGHYLVVGAADEDSAADLAQRLEHEAPEGSSVLAEGTMPAVLRGAPLNPFAIFGGLGA